MFKESMGDKVIAVIGATGSLGSELCRRLARINANVIIAYYEKYEYAKELEHIFFRHGKNCYLVHCDITSEVSIEDMVREVMENYHKIDVLINIAGIAIDRPTTLMDLSCWNSVINVNLTGVYLCCKHVLRKMIPRRQGKIINIGSYKGMVVEKGQANYCSSKAGVIALTKTMAKEVGQYNISINTICPGFVQTDLNNINNSALERAKESSYMSIEHNLMDVINFILFMISDEVRGISGQVFYLGSRIMD